MARFRQRGSLQDQSTNQKDYNAPPPQGNGALAVNVTRTSSAKAQGLKETITDVTTPQFKKLMASGSIVMSPVSISRDERSTSRDTYTFDAAGTVAAFWGKRVVTGECACAWSNPPTVPTWFATRVADAKTRTLLMAHSRVASENFLGLVTVKEANKTASMISRPFGQASDLLDRVVRRRAALMKKGMNVLKAGTTAFLEYRFGWKPLLFEVQGIFDSWLHNTQYYSKPTRLVSRASDQDISWQSEKVVTLSRNEGCFATVASRYDHSAKVSSGVLYEITETSLAMGQARRMGLRLSDVPASIWEAVPLSFVVDRFVDIGVWLNAITPKPGVTIKGSWTSTKTRQHNTHKILRTYVTFVPSYPVTLEGGHGGHYDEAIQSFDRVVNPVLPILPTVNYRDLSLVQNIDHAALILQRLSGLRTGSLRI